MVILLYHVNKLQVGEAYQDNLPLFLCYIRRLGRLAVLKYLYTKLASTFVMRRKLLIFKLFGFFLFSPSLL